MRVTTDPLNSTGWQNRVRFGKRVQVSLIDDFESLPAIEYDGRDDDTIPSASLASSINDTEYLQPLSVVESKDTTAAVVSVPNVDDAAADADDGDAANDDDPIRIANDLIGNLRCRGGSDRSSGSNVTQRCHLPIGYGSNKRSLHRFRDTNSSLIIPSELFTLSDNFFPKAEEEKDRRWDSSPPPPPPCASSLSLSHAPGEVASHLLQVQEPNKISSRRSNARMTLLPSMKSSRDLFSRLIVETTRSNKKNRTDKNVAASTAAVAAALPPSIPLRKASAESFTTTTTAAAVTSSSSNDTTTRRAANIERKRHKSMF